MFADELNDGFLTIAKLKDGSSFGELALIDNKPRMATIRCLRNTNFMVLSKNDYNSVLGVIERRDYQEKINFLKNIPILKVLTRTTLGKLTKQFEPRSCIKGAFLYQEGDPADAVYIVKKGEFQANKKIVQVA